MKRFTRLFPACTPALALLFGLSSSAFANDPVKEYVVVTNTQHMDLPANGTVRLLHALDEITIEGWDQPGVEITTIKSTAGEYAPAEREKARQELDKVKISAERKGDELVIATTVPRGFTFLAPPGSRGIGLQYRIMVPRSARLIVNGSGEAHFFGVTGDIQAKMHQGEITVRLPEQAQYGIDASSKFGVVISDFPGDTKRHYWFAHSFAANSQAPHKLLLRAGFGDIMILKVAQTPAPPAAHS